jgi:hypothetical protein
VRSETRTTASPWPVAGSSSPSSRRREEFFR